MSKSKAPDANHRHVVVPRSSAKFARRADHILNQRVNIPRFVFTHYRDQPLLAEIVSAPDAGFSNSIRKEKQSITRMDGRPHFLAVPLLKCSEYGRGGSKPFDRAVRAQQNRREVSAVHIAEHGSPLVEDAEKQSCEMFRRRRFIEELVHRP